MIIKKKTAKPVTVKHEIDRIEIVTYYGGQSTDYAARLFSGKTLIQETDVDSIEHGIKYLASLIAHPPTCQCEQCKEEEE